MPSCVPISELKDTTAFCRKVETAGEPVIVTKNGYEKLIVLDPELFKQYRRETPEEHLERLLEESDRDIRAGNISDARADLEEMMARHAL